MSAEECVTPLDVFPPVPPSDLRLFWRTEQTELSWRESASTDVAGVPRLPLRTGRRRLPAPDGNAGRADELHGRGARPAGRVSLRRHGGGRRRPAEREPALRPPYRESAVSGRDAPRRGPPAAVMALPAWNAGLQTGTRGAPHRARRNPTRKGGSRLGPELNSEGDAHGLERRLQPARAVLRTAHGATPRGRGGSRLGAALFGGGDATAWNAGLQTGTRGAPHRARRDSMRKGGSRLGVALIGGSDATAWNAGLDTGTRGAPHRARRNSTRKGWLPPRRRAHQRR